MHFLQQHGILHNPRICGNGHNMVLQLRAKGDRWRCHSRECRTEVSLRKDTWMEGSKLGFREVTLFIYCWSRELTSMSFVEHELGISHCAAVDYNNYLREVCAADLLQNPIRIGGRRGSSPCARIIKVEFCLSSGYSEVGAVRRVKVTCSQCPMVVLRHYYQLSKPPFYQAPRSCRTSGERMAGSQRWVTII